MDNHTPKCINCGKALDSGAYLGFCSDCALFYANPLFHTITSVIIGIIGIVLFNYMSVSEGDETNTALYGGLLFTLMGFGWNFMSSFGFKATGVISGCIKFALSPFVGIIGCPVILFRLFTYKS